MLKVAEEKIQPIYRVAVDAPADDWQQYIAKNYVPFIFLENIDGYKSEC